MPIVRNTRMDYVSRSTDRKSRYRTDPSYREQAKHFSRRSYRRRAGVELDTCLHSLSFLDQRGHMEVTRMPNGKVKEFHVFYLSETAKMLQKRYQTIWRWIGNGMLPPPVLVVRLATAKPHEAYHMEEVRIFIEEIGAHEKKVAYFRKDHKHITARIEQRVADLRKALFK